MNKMKIKILLYPLCMALLLSSCHIYKQYSRPEVDTQGLYRDPVSTTDTLVSDTSNMANLPWEQVFTDPEFTGVDSLGFGEKYGFTGGLAEGERGSGQLDDLPFVLFTFSFFGASRRSK